MHVRKLGGLLSCIMADCRFRSSELPLHILLQTKGATELLFGNILNSFFHSFVYLMVFSFLHYTLLTFPFFTRFWPKEHTWKIRPLVYKSRTQGDWASLAHKKFPERRRRRHWGLQIYMDRGNQYSTSTGKGILSQPYKCKLENSVERAFGYHFAYHATLAEIAQSGMK